MTAKRLKIAAPIIPLTRDVGPGLCRVSVRLADWHRIMALCNQVGADIDACIHRDSPTGQKWAALRAHLSKRRPSELVVRRLCEGSNTDRARPIVVVKPRPALHRLLPYLHDWGR